MTVQYDILFLEALGEERGHLRQALAEAKAAGRIPRDFSCYIGPETLQDYLSAHPQAQLPDIVSIKTHSRIPREWLTQGNKKSILSRSAGYDHVESLAHVANVTSLREYCVNAVAETAVKLLLCAAGNLNQYTQNTLLFQRDGCISFKELTGCKATVFGMGRIGSRICQMLTGLGLQTRAVDIRSGELTPPEGVELISKEDATDSDVVICAMNYTADPGSRFYNRNYFSGDYLSRFPRGLVFVNVTRGDIAPEGPLLELYRRGRIFGLGLDVFENEAEVSRLLRQDPDAQSPALEIIRAALDRRENFYVQAHQGFNSDKAALTKAVETVRHLEDYCAGGFRSQLPYYT